MRLANKRHKNANSVLARDSNNRETYSLHHSALDAVEPFASFKKHDWIKITLVVKNRTLGTASEFYNR